jgi:hypothetical protein
MPAAPKQAKAELNADEAWILLNLFFWFAREGESSLESSDRAMIPALHRLREAGARSELATRRKW